MRESVRAPIHILQVVGRMNPAGTETWLMHILRDIDREQFMMDFLTHTPDACAYDDEIRALGSRIIPCPNSTRPLSYARDFTQILRQHGPYDIVHSHLHHFSGFVMWLAAMSGVPVRIAHSHNDITVKEKCAGALRRAYLNMTERLIAQYATAGFGVSRNSAQCLFGDSWESDRRWRVNHLGIDLKPFRAAVDPEVLRRELGFPPDAFVVGHVGRFAPQKNHTFLVEIAAELVRLRPDARILLVGDGPLRPEVERKVQALGITDNVLFAGLRPDVPRLMLGAMDVLLLPSLHEGLPLTLMEAHAAGLPSVYSDIITDEADIIGSLVTRLSLDDPPERWAEAALSAAGRRLATDVALAHVEQTDFNIAVSVSRLAEFYHKSVCRR